MPKLIKQGVFIDNPWCTLDKGQLPAADAHNVLIHTASYPATTPPHPALGIWLDSSDTLASLPSNLKTLAVIAIHFPVFMDGRGFSLGRQIREQLNYTGELRAIGQFIPDQALYLKRCGFDSFAVAEDTDVNTYQTLLGAFADSYQAAVDEPRPLFRRRG